MARFAIGDVVNRGKNNTGKVVAVYTTTDGELKYAVENEGALEFVLEAELSPRQAEHQAA
jgi:hypothetical protein